MIGKKVRVNDYKFTYGEETIYINLYGVFKNKIGNKYGIYSYSDKPNKLFYGTYFKRNDEAVIMASKENPKELVKEFTESVLEDNYKDKFEIITLNEIKTIEIIDEYEADFNIDLNKLKDLTIPKPVVKKEKVEQKKGKKPISLAVLFFIIFLIVVIAFFFINPEVIIGKDKIYSCTKNYLHKKLPASVSEEISLTFSGQGNITSIDLTRDYKFNDMNYYKEFKDKGYFYQYMEENDTYKFIEDKYTYRLFSKVDVESEEFFMPTEEQELTKNYEEKGYTCKRVETNE